MIVFQQIRWTRVFFLRVWKDYMRKRLCWISKRKQQASPFIPFDAFFSIMPFPVPQASLITRGRNKKKRPTRSHASVSTEVVSCFLEDSEEVMKFTSSGRLYVGNDRQPLSSVLLFGLYTLSRFVSFWFLHWLRIMLRAFCH